MTIKSSLIDYLGSSAEGDTIGKVLKSGLGAEGDTIGAIVADAAASGSSNDSGDEEGKE